MTLSKAEEDMIEPTFDRDGDPTDETLKAIEQWKPYPEESLLALLRFVQKAWHYEDGAAEKNGLFVFATGGWSGNESLMAALQRSFAYSYTSWVIISGGFYCLAVTQEARRKIETYAGRFRAWTRMR